jgi:glycosyltransferase involved in cell wall biosynthesis
LLWVTFLYLDLDLHKTSRIEILKGLSRQGYDVTLFAAYSKKKPSAEELGVRVYCIPVSRAPIIAFVVLAMSLIILLPLLILKLKPQFVIAEPQFGTFFGLISARTIPNPVRPKIIVDIRSIPVESTGLSGWLDNVCFDIAMFVAREILDGMTTITQMMRDLLCAKFSINPGYVGIWSSGVSLEVFDVRQHAGRRQELRARLGIDNNFVVLYHGAVTANRGIAEAIASLELLEAKYRNVIFLIIGKGPALESVKAASQKWIKEGRVIFHKPVEYMKMPDYISACDIGIVPLPDLPEWRIQCPLNLLECLAMAKAVVATDIPANKEVTTENRSVIYASSADAEGIAKAIRYAFDNRNMLNEWGTDGRLLIERQFNWNVIARRLDQYLSNC